MKIENCKFRTRKLCCCRYQMSLQLFLYSLLCRRQSLVLQLIKERKMHSLFVCGAHYIYIITIVIRFCVSLIPHNVEWRTLYCNGKKCCLPGSNERIKKKRERRITEEVLGHGWHVTYVIRNTCIKFLLAKHCIQKYLCVLYTTCEWRVWCKYRWSGMV